jgi:hypothetical protein
MKKIGERWKRRCRTLERCRTEQEKVKAEREGLLLMTRPEVSCRGKGWSCTDRMGL